MPIYLNLASGTDHRPPPWVNLDLTGWPGYPDPDIVWDARKDRLPFEDNSVDGVVAGYLLEHMGHGRYHRRVLEDAFRVLKPECVLQVGGIDYERVFARWLADPTNEATCELIWGEQGHHEGRPELEQFEAMHTDHHCWGYTEASLRALLQSIGFGDFRRIWLHDRTANYYELTLECAKPKSRIYFICDEEEIGDA